MNTVQARGPIVESSEGVLALELYGNLGHDL
jgi:hypothetical protein